MGLASVTERDFLVIGGGSAGCIVAKRLAERTTGRTILLEAGKSDEGDAAATNLPRLDEQTEAYDWASGLRHSQTADPNWIVPAPDFWGALLTTMSAPSCGHPIRISMRGRIGVQQAGGCGYGPLFQPSHAKRRGRGSPTSFRQCSLRKGRQRAWPAGNRFSKADRRRRRIHSTKCARPCGNPHPSPTCILFPPCHAIWRSGQRYGPRES